MRTILVRALMVPGVSHIFKAKVCLFLAAAVNETRYLKISLLGKRLQFSRLFMWIHCWKRQPLQKIRYNSDFTFHLKVASPI